MNGAPGILRQRGGRRTRIKFGNDKEKRQTRIPFGNDKQKGRTDGAGQSLLFPIMTMRLS
jgi:hypothetical protein